MVQPRLTAIVRIDGDVLMRKIGGPHRGTGIATPQLNTHGNFSVVHHGLALLFPVVRMATAILGHIHIAQIKLNFGLIQIINACIPYRLQNATKVGVRCKECGFHQGRMANCIGHFQGFVFVTGLLHLHRNEFGGAFTIAHNRLGQLDRFSF